jgi:hypothetical protein
MGPTETDPRRMRWPCWAPTLTAATAGPLGLRDPMGLQGLHRRLRMVQPSSHLYSRHCGVDGGVVLDRPLHLQEQMGRGGKCDVQDVRCEVWCVRCEVWCVRRGWGHGQRDAAHAQQWTGPSTGRAAMGAQGAGSGARPTRWAPRGDPSPPCLDRCDPDTPTRVQFCTADCTAGLYCRSVLQVHAGPEAQGPALMSGRRCLTSATASVTFCTCAHERVYGTPHTVTSHACVLARRHAHTRAGLRWLSGLNWGGVQALRWVRPSHIHPHAHTHTHTQTRVRTYTAGGTHVGSGSRSQG